MSVKTDLYGIWIGMPTAVRNAILLTTLAAVLTAAVAVTLTLATGLRPLGDPIGENPYAISLLKNALM